MTNSKKSKMVAASVAGLMAMGTVVLATASAEEMGAAGAAAPCYGINACKGVGDCGGKGHACAGKNACKGMGFLKVPADACTKINGGTLTGDAQ